MSEDFTFHLDEVFHGPMDLLLHLVREQEVEIQEVEISRILRGYLEYLRSLPTLDIEVAGDFLVMASTLMAIKSRSLLPQEEVDLEEDLDPRDELIQRLIEYRRFKSTSEDLGRRFEERALRVARGAFPELEREGDEPELDLGELTAWDLLGEYARLLRETLSHRTHRVAGEARPLRFYVTEMARTLRERQRVSLRSMLGELGPAPARESLIGSFCALLELMKLGWVRAHQESSRDDIEIELAGDEAQDLDALLGASSFADEEEEDAGDAKRAAAEADPAAGDDPSAEDAPSADPGEGPVEPAPDDAAPDDAPPAAGGAERSPAPPARNRSAGL